MTNYNEIQERLNLMLESANEMVEIVKVAKLHYTQKAIEELESCENCKHLTKEGTEYPCNECSQNFNNMFEKVIDEIKKIEPYDSNDSEYRIDDIVKDEHRGYGVVFDVNYNIKPPRVSIYCKDGHVNYYGDEIKELQKKGRFEKKHLTRAKTAIDDLNKDLFRERED